MAQGVAREEADLPDAGTVRCEGTLPRTSRISPDMPKPSGSLVRFNYRRITLDSERSARAAAFDPKLSRRFLHRRLHGGIALFIEVLAFHGFLGSSNGRFRGCFIDFLFEDGHIGQYRDRLLCDLDKARLLPPTGFPGHPS